MGPFINQDDYFYRAYNPINQAKPYVISALAYLC